MKIWWSIDQGSAAWYKLRASIPTASRFDEVMTPKKRELAEARKKYACQIIAGRLLNWQAESLDKIKHIEDGKAYEPIAVRQLEMIEGIETVPVGFVTTDDGRWGASPDRMIGVKQGEQPDEVPCTVEVKSPTIPKQMEYIIWAEMLRQGKTWTTTDTEKYPCQVQGQIMVCRSRRALFYSARERMPAVYIPTKPDHGFIGKLHDCLSRFCDELDQWTDIAKAAGAYQMFEDIAPPAEAEYEEQLAADDKVLTAIIEGELGNRLAWGA